MKKIILFTAIIFCFLENLTIAQTFTNYTNVNTTPLNQVNDYSVISIAIDSDGNKWFGTKGFGVSKFDGYSWVTYTTANGLANDTVTSIAIDEYGNKWFATRGGVSKFENNIWTTYTTSNGLLNNIVNSIAIDTLGRKWFCTNTGISVYNDTIWSYFIWGNTNGGLPNFPINTMIIDDYGNEWFGTNYSGSSGCVVKYDNTGHSNSSVGWTKYIQSKPVLSIAVDAQGNIWAGTNQGGVLKFNGSTWVTYNTSNGLANNIVNAIAIDTNGNKWFGTNGGVSMFDGVNWTNYSNIPAYNSVTTTLAHNTVNCIVIENTNNLWFGTNGRLSKFDGQKWSVFPTYGLKNDIYYSSACDSTDNKWFGSSNSGVTKYDGTTWLTYNTSNGLIGNSVKAIAIDSFNNKWFGTSEGVSMFNDFIWTNFPSSGGTAPVSVTCMAVDNQNNIWVGTQNGLYKYNGVYWVHYTTQTIFSTSNGVSYQTISGIAIDLMGNIWCTSLYWSCIAKYDGINWVRFDNSNTLFFNPLTIDSADNKWICSDDGVIKFDNTNYTKYSYSEGSYPFSNGPNTIAIDNHENIWAGGDGIQYFNGVSWVAFLNSPSGFNDVRSCTISEENVKWFTTSGGVSKFTLPEDLLPFNPSSISGLTSVCQNQNFVTYSVLPITNATSYSWTLPFGAIGSSSTNSISVDFSSNSISGNITVCGLNSYGQGISKTLSITVNPFPANAGTISGTATVCQGQNSITYNVPTISNATSYIWTLPIGATGTSSTNSISVNYGTSATSGNITVKGNNTCGEGAVSTLPITVNPLPANAGTISGEVAVCQGQNSVIYTIPAIANATSYVWALPSGATGTSTTNSISVNYGASATSGNIIVKGNNTCGDGAVSTLPITVNPLPAIAGTISGDVAVCQGQNSVIYTIPAISNATSYVWTLPSGATGTSTTNSITLDYGVSASSGNITVKGTNSCGDGAVSTLPISVNIIPTTPTITLNGLVLNSDASSGNQWYDQNGIISGATNQNYTVAVDGDYYVIVRLNGCSSDPSNTINVTGTGIEAITSEKIIKVYPNPVSNELIIEIEDNNEKVNFDILNAIGQVVFKGNLVDKTTVQTSNLAPGVYLIKLENGKTFEFKKVIKE